MFQVTEDCIRKDLKTLENAGKLKRTYGGAILSQDYPPGKRCYRQKKLSCGQEDGDRGQGYDVIKEREAIFLDISTTNIELAKLLAKSKCSYRSEQHDRYFTAA